MYGDKYHSIYRFSGVIGVNDFASRRHPAIAIKNTNKRNVLRRTFLFISLFNQLASGQIHLNEPKQVVNCFPKYFGHLGLVWWERQVWIIFCVHFFFA